MAAPSWRALVALLLTTATVLALVESRSARHRRTLTSDLGARWPGAVVPYVKDPALLTGDHEESRAVDRVLSWLQQWTCVRFVPWTAGTGQALGLGHESYVYFHDQGRCETDFLGFKNDGAQRTRCCTGETCAHEMGHVLGALHEHVTPARHGWIRVNPDNIQQDKKVDYVARRPEDVINNSDFDIQSVMIYPDQIDAKSFNVKSYDLLFSDLKPGHDLFYLLRDVAIGYKCGESDACAGSTLTCDNDGFRSVVGGVCACVCPDGLDPATGCRDVRRGSDVTSFPGGSWALPMPASGCPEGFLEGYREPVADNPRGPHVYSESFHLRGGRDPWRLRQSFCVSQGAGSAGAWGQANMCLLREGGACPQVGDLDLDEFKEGFINLKFYSRPNARVNESGELPDGDFRRTETTWQYCCRQAGFPREFPLSLPADKPIAIPVPKYPFEECPKVHGMHEVSEFIGIGGNNLEEYSSEFYSPYMKRESIENTILKRLYIRHCYYQPALTDCGGAITLDTTTPIAAITAPTGSHRHCHWLVTGPPGSRVVVELTEMHIPASADGTCGSDYVNVRHFLLGQTGTKYCGSESRSATSFANRAMLTFVTGDDSQASFKATFSLVTDESLCYLAGDRGLTYGGRAHGVTRGGRPCLPWAEMTHCPHHPLNPSDSDKRLEGSACRNPDASFMPWCYTDAEGCQRDYCDVCHRATNYNIPAEQRQAPNLKAAVTVRCGAPPALIDAQADDAKDSYAVGETATYTCPSNAVNTLTRTCLSDGSWTPASHVCRPGCAVGWAEHRGLCYKYFGELKKGLDAKDACEALGGTLGEPRDEELHTFLLELMQEIEGPSAVGNRWLRAWLGATSDRRGELHWNEDEAPLGFTHFSRRYRPRRRSGMCLYEDAQGNWATDGCAWGWKRYRYFCQAHLSAGECEDALHTCPALQAADPQFCTNNPAFADKNCQRTCGMCHDAAGHEACALPTLTDGVELVDASLAAWSSVPSGLTVALQCAPGYTAAGGGDVVCHAGAVEGQQLSCLKHE